MAGIGFVLRKLYRQDNLSGLFRAYLHSAFASTGPWLFTVLALGTIATLGNGMVGTGVLFDFRVVLIYNFSFSLVVSGPIFMIATRYMADAIYRRDATPAPGLLLGSLALLWGLGMMIAAPFYFLYADLTPAMAISALVNFLLLSGMWLVSIFISALKNYQLITRSFFCGMLVAVIACTLLAKPYGAVGLLNGFSMGVATIMGLLLAVMLVEYPYPIKQPFAFLGYFRKYWEIALAGLVYNMAVWVDKWIMWFAPEATRTASGLVIYPAYDSAMFFAYLTTVPSMAMFLFSIETHFFEHYMRYYRDIQNKASFAKIRRNHHAVARSIFGSAKNFFLLQGSIAFLGMLMAPEIIAALNGNYLQIGMLRYGLIGSLFHVLTLFLLVLLSYFDSRRLSLLIQLVFLLTNALFTWASMQGGFQYYGYGYFLSSFLTFIIAAMLTTQYVMRLPYHTFITTNASIRQQGQPVKIVKSPEVSR
jgi:polysaccharide biosynthesis protein PelG